MPHRLAELAGDAALLAGGVPPQHVLAPEPGADRPLLEGVVHLTSPMHAALVVALMQHCIDDGRIVGHDRAVAIAGEQGLRLLDRCSVDAR